MIDPALKNALRDVAIDEERRRNDDAKWIARASSSPPRGAEARFGAAPASNDGDGAGHEREESEEEFMRALTAPKGGAFEERIAAAVGLAAPAPQRAEVAPSAKAMPRRSARLYYIGAPILAAAAAVALFLRSPTGSDSPLPAYAMTVEGGDVTSRGDSPAPVAGERITFTAGAHVVVIARPEMPVASQVIASGSLVRGAESRPLGAPGVVSSSGAARFEGSFETLFGNARGDWDLVIAIKPAAQSERAAGEYRQPVRLIDRK